MPLHGSILLGAISCIAGQLSAQSLRTVTLTRDLRSEKSFDLDVEFAAGTLDLRPTGDGALYRLRLTYDEDRFKPLTEHDESSAYARLGVQALEGRSMSLRDRRLERQNLALEISPRVITSLNLKFGAGHADLELGELAIKELTVATGASDTRLRWSAPNAIRCTQLELFVGAVTFEAHRLGDARCRDIRITGGVGNVHLDFTGTWTGNTDATIEMGLGTLALYFPRELGVSIHLERFLVGFDRAGFIKRGDRYYSPGWDQADIKLRLRISAALGDIQVFWSESTP